MINIRQSNITIFVKNIDKAINFYKGIGLILKKRWDDHYAMLETTGITIGLHPAGKNMARASSQVSIGFIIDDIKEVKSLLSEKKIYYKEEYDKSGLYVHFNDLDGTYLYFTQPKWR